MAHTRTRQQAGLTGLYLGLFTPIWFSIPKAEGALVVLLGVGNVAALLTAVVGIVVVWRARRQDPARRNRDTDRRYLLIVLAELVAAGLGALLLWWAGWSQYIPVLVGAVVGVHFFLLVRVLRDPHLRLLGAVVCAVALAGLIAELATSVPAGSVVGVGTGFALLGYAVMALAGGLRR